VVRSTQTPSCCPQRRSRSTWRSWLSSLATMIPTGLRRSFASRISFLMSPSLSDLGSPFSKFRFESSPCALVLTVVFVLEQPERLLRAELRDAGEVLHPE